MIVASPQPVTTQQQRSHQGQEGDVEAQLKAHRRVNKTHRPLAGRGQIDGAERAVGAVDRQLALVAFLAAKGPDKRLPARKVGVSQYQPAAITQVDIDKNVIRGVTANLCFFELRAGGDQCILRPRRFFNEDQVAQVTFQQRLFFKRGDARFWHNEGPRHHLLVFVNPDHPIVIDRLPAWIGDHILSEDVFDVEQIQEWVVKRRKHLRAKIGIDRRDAVVEQFTRLRRNLVHQLHILAGDDRVVAAQIVPAVVHAHVGIEGLTPRPVKGRKAPRRFKLTIDH